MLFTKATVHDKGGQVLGLIATLSDLSELKEAQRNLGEIESQKQAILDGFPGTLALLNCDLKVVWSNRAKNNDGAICAGLADQSCHQLLLGKQTPCADCAVRRSILNGHGGRVEVHSELGAGEPHSISICPLPPAPLVLWRVCSLFLCLLAGRNMYWPWTMMSRLLIL